MVEHETRFVLILGDAEATALRAYAEREGLSVSAAARKLVAAALARREEQQRCPHCQGTGWG